MGSGQLLADEADCTWMGDRGQWSPMFRNPCCHQTPSKLERATDPPLVRLGMSGTLAGWCLLENRNETPSKAMTFRF